jgi:hypothetical protein
VKNPRIAPEDLKFPLELYHFGSRLGEEAGPQIDLSVVSDMQFSIRNASPFILAGDKYRLAIVAPRRMGVFFGSDHGPRPGSVMSDGRIVYVMPSSLPQLFPDEFHSFSFRVNQGARSLESTVIFLRVFTEHGMRDFPVTLFHG